MIKGDDIDEESKSFKFIRVELKPYNDGATIAVRKHSRVINVTCEDGLYFAHLLVPTKSALRKEITFYFLTSVEEISEELLDRLTYVGMDLIPNGNRSYDYRYIYYR